MTEKQKKAVADAITDLTAIGGSANNIAETVTNIAEAKKLARKIVTKARQAKDKLDKAFAPA